MFRPAPPRTVSARHQLNAVARKANKMQARAGTNTISTALFIVRDDGVAGSNPATPTRHFNDLAKPQDGECTASRTDTSDFRALVALPKPRTGRPPKGPRLYLRNDEDGTRSWIIRDTGRDLRTGCKEGDDLAAVEALVAYNDGQPILTREDVIAGLVYFVTCTSSAHYPIKIGWTKSMDSRMQSMQGGNPNVLTALATTPGTYKDERELHSLFRHLHIRGEWFRRSDDLLDYIRQLPGYRDAYGEDEFK